MSPHFLIHVQPGHRSVAKCPGTQTSGDFLISNLLQGSKPRSPFCCEAVTIALALHVPTHNFQRHQNGTEQSPGASQFCTLGKTVLAADHTFW